MAIHQSERRRRLRSLRWLLLSIAAMMAILSLVDVMLTPPETSGS